VGGRHKQKQATQEAATQQKETQKGTDLLVATVSEFQRSTAEGGLGMGEEVHSLALAVSIQRKMVFWKREVGISSGCGDGTEHRVGGGMGRR
jgi:hypothetical protein